MTLVVAATIVLFLFTIFSDFCLFCFNAGETNDGNLLNEQNLSMSLDATILTSILHTQLSDKSAVPEAHKLAASDSELFCKIDKESELSAGVDNLYQEIASETYTIEYDCKDTLDTDDFVSEFIQDIQPNKEHKDQEDSEYEKPLYEGSTLTVGAAMVLVLTFAIRFQLPADGLSHLLLLLNLLTLQGSKLCRTVHMFKNMFSCLKNPIVYHHYCGNCYYPIKPKVHNSCPNKHCLSDVTSNGKQAYFIEIPLYQQLQAMFHRPGFFDDLQYRFNREKRNPNNIEDIFDGKLYKERFDNDGFLSSRKSISFLWNTDGVPIFKSSKFSIWPLYLVINELKPQKRFKSENLILTGLWFGDKKPLMWLFLKPFYFSMVTLQQGWDFQVTHKNQETEQMKIKGMLLAGSCEFTCQMYCMWT